MLFRLAPLTQSGRFPFSFTIRFYFSAFNNLPIVIKPKEFHLFMNVLGQKSRTLLGLMEVGMTTNDEGGAVFRVGVRVILVWVRYLPLLRGGIEVA